MTRQRLAHGRAVAVDHVEHALGHAGLVHDFGEDVRAERRDFAGLEHHRAAGGQRGSDFAADLIERPVPRGDQAAHADRFATDLRRAQCFFELEFLQRGERRHEMSEAAAGLCIQRELHRRAHLVGDRQGDVLHAGLIDLDDALEQCDALFTRRLRVGFESSARRFHRDVHVLGRAEHDLADFLFGGRIDRPPARADPAG